MGYESLLSAQKTSSPALLLKASTNETNKLSCKVLFVSINFSPVSPQELEELKSISSLSFSESTDYVPQFDTRLEEAIEEIREISERECANHKMELELRHKDRVSPHYARKNVCVRMPIHHFAGTDNRKFRDS